MKQKKLARSSIYRLVRNAQYELWGADGKRGNYTVLIDRTKEKYLCSCGNIRNTECYHIKGLKEVRKMPMKKYNLVDANGDIIDSTIAESREAAAIHFLNDMDYMVDDE